MEVPSIAQVANLSTWRIRCLLILKVNLVVLSILRLPNKSQIIPILENRWFQTHHLSIATLSQMVARFQSKVLVISHWIIINSISIRQERMVEQSSPTVKAQTANFLLITKTPLSTIRLVFQAVPFNFSKNLLMVQYNPQA